MQDPNTSLQIVLAEYQHQQARHEKAIDTINHSLTTYLAVITLLIPVGLLAMERALDKGIGGRGGLLMIVFAVASLSTCLTLGRTYRARIEQTLAARAISRLKRFFVDQEPEIEPYLSGTIYDDWPTPYTHRRQSLAFWGWMVFVAWTGFLAALSLAAGLDAWLQLRNEVTWTVALATGSLISLLLYRALDRRLAARKDRDKPRFPKKLGERHQIRELEPPNDQTVSSSPTSADEDTMRTEHE